jgi:hypothetical protein
MEIQVGHLLKQMSGRRRCCDCDAYSMLETFGRFVCAEEGVYCGCSVEMGYFFFFEEIPDERVVYLAETVISASNAGDGPSECPA